MNNIKYLHKYNNITLDVAGIKQFQFSSCVIKTDETVKGFKSLVCRRLVECGWMDEVTMLCKEKLKDRLSKGQTVQSITEDDLFNDVAPDARRGRSSRLKYVCVSKICS
ncbi:enhancer of yellow 2 transcription factor isoform X2 [Metopolophium dirhodum]|uniref:enhancer of yellow 2 transcription factor isoform X2 n=1 Tax=Metopolophium dirhodum TaxID=44670 RepID=UPI00298F6C3F|nr:enhancer of yellow 2 transcription factor isoform X2 [Metopolophium dirhodum]